MIMDILQDPIIQALFGIGMLLVVLLVLYRAMVQRHNERNKR